MTLLLRLKKLAESLDTEDGLKMDSSSEITLILESGDRLDVGKDLARKIFGSSDNIQKMVPLLEGTESLELHNVKVSDDVWLKLDEVFTVEEV